ncbi:hypothetical protein FRB94_006394 [Tulasnella sp. JGI-2019a]|nr:hypothetical protein FRB94_006394 [Tulasnella sp. JGI-2019a]KAG9037904.1 hypothetical protein FRB95_003744 [Tulasnella sp. JGI-2019a]
MRPLAIIAFVLLIACTSPVSTAPAAHYSSFGQHGIILSKRSPVTLEGLLSNLKVLSKEETAALMTLRDNGETRVAPDVLARIEAKAEAGHLSSKKALLAGKLPKLDKVVAHDDVAKEGLRRRPSTFSSFTMSRSKTPPAMLTTFEECYSRLYPRSIGA